MKRPIIQSRAAALALALCLVSTPLMAETVPFKIRENVKNFISEGRCQMSECSVVKWLNVSEIGRTKNAITLQLTLQGGGFTADQTLADAKWADAPHFVKVVCSYEAPTVDGVELELGKHVPGSMADVERIYLNACHSTELFGPDVTLKLGYKAAPDEDEKATAQQPDTKSYWKNVYRQKTPWINAKLTAVEGWWAYDAAGCNDKEDNKDRWMLGRQTKVRGDGGGVVTFGVGDPQYSAYESNCVLSRPQLLKGDVYAFDAACEAEGEKTKEIFMFDILSPTTIRVAQLVKGTKDLRKNIWIQCPREEN